MILSLPFPPSTNHLFSNKFSGRGKTEKYKAWIRDAGWTVKAQVGGKKLIGQWSAEITAFRPDKRRRDIDNVIKPVCDLLVRIGVVPDDCEMQSVTARWADTDGEGVKVHLFQHNERRGVT